MKLSVVAVLIASIFVLCNSAFGDQYVRGYYRKNGTYVAPHYRSSPNNTKLDNWSTKGNINPYTGKTGTKNLDDESSYPYFSPPRPRAPYGNSFSEDDDNDSSYPYFEPPRPRAPYER